MQRNNVKILKEQLFQKERELYSIQKISQALSSTLRLENLLLLIMREITGLMNADRSTFYVVDQEKEEIWSIIALKAEIKEIRQKIGSGISGYVAATGKTLNIADAYNDSRFDPSTDRQTGYRTQSVLCMPVWEPLREQENPKIIGVLQVLNKKEGQFTSSDESLLAAIASQVAVSLSNARLYRELESKYDEIDLLYEFEQMLSVFYDLDDLFGRMLHRTIEHLDGIFAGVLFQLNQELHLIAVDDQRNVLKESASFSGTGAGDSDPQILSSDLPIQITGIQQKFKILGNRNLSEINVFPVEAGTEGAPKLFLLFQPQNNHSAVWKDDDELMLEIVGQKVARALQLYSLRSALIEKERLSTIGHLMSSVLHDLRGPLNNIYGFLDLLLDKETTETESQEFAGIIRLEMQSINNMMREVLDFAHGKTNILPRKNSVVDITKRFQPLAEQLFRNSEIRFDLTNHSKKSLYVDLEKIIRVFYNIAKNSKEAMGEHGEFTMNILDADDRVVFELKDTGPGIPPHIRGRLFESFVTSGKEGGTGLGLAIVKKVIDEHHGEIRIVTAEKKGTTFTILLPEFKKEIV